MNIIGDLFDKTCILLEIFQILFYHEALKNNKQNIHFVLTLYMGGSGILSVRKNIN